MVTVANYELHGIFLVVQIENHVIGSSTSVH